MKKMFMSALLLSLGFLYGCSTQNTQNELIDEKPTTQVAEDLSQSTEQDTVDDDKPSQEEIINLDFVKEHMNDEQYVLVDTRINDAYIGWKVNNISRGGHIPGAVDFSANWLDVEKENKDKILQDALDTKGITTGKDIILYDTEIANAEKVKTFLQGKGFENIHIFDLSQWINDETLELEKYANYQMIVPAYIIKEIIDGAKPESFENAQTIKIVESSWGPETESYLTGHIPTAFHIDTDSFEPPPAWMLDSDENLSQWALKYGFNSNDTVIVTGNDQMAAYRLAIVLRYIGVSDVRVLNGGNDAWLAAGYKLDTDSIQPTAVNDFGANIPVNPDLVVTIPELKEYLQKPEEYILVDNRGWDEFIGETSGYSYHDKKGRIPGAVFGYAGTEGSGDLNYYRNIDNTIRNQQEVEALWKSQNIDSQKHMMFMCGSGWRVAEVLTYANVYGYDNCSIYSDGWIGWSNDPNNPFETGDPTATQ